MRAGKYEDWKLVQAILDPFNTVAKPQILTPVQLMRVLVLSEKYRFTSVKNYCERLLGGG